VLAPLTTSVLAPAFKRPRTPSGPLPYTAEKVRLRSVVSKPKEPPAWMPAVASSPVTCGSVTSPPTARALPLTTTVLPGLIAETLGIASVPADTITRPVSVLAAESRSRPVPAFTRSPEPLTTPESSASIEARPLSTCTVRATEPRAIGLAKVSVPLAWEFESTRAEPAGTNEPEPQVT